MSSRWPSVKASELLRALQRIGWVIIRQSGSHRTLERKGARCTFAFHDSETIGPKMMAKMAKKTGLDREDL